KAYESDGLAKGGRWKRGSQIGSETDIASWRPTVGLTRKVSKNQTYKVTFGIQELPNIPELEEHPEVDILIPTGKSGQAGLSDPCTGDSKTRREVTWKATFTLYDADNYGSPTKQVSVDAVRGSPARITVPFGVACIPESDMGLAGEVIGKKVPDELKMPLVLKLTPEGGREITVPYLKYKSEKPIIYEVNVSDEMIYNLFIDRPSGGNLNIEYTDPSGKVVTAVYIETPSESQGRRKEALGIGTHTFKLTWLNAEVSDKNKTKINITTYLKVNVRPALMVSLLDNNNNEVKRSSLNNYNLRVTESKSFTVVVTSPEGGELTYKVIDFDNTDYADGKTTEKEHTIPLFGIDETSSGTFKLKTSWKKGSTIIKRNINITVNIGLTALIGQANRTGAEDPEILYPENGVIEIEAIDSIYITVSSKVPSGLLNVTIKKKVVGDSDFKIVSTNKSKDPYAYEFKADYTTVGDYVVKLIWENDNGAKLAEEEYTIKINKKFQMDYPTLLIDKIGDTLLSRVSETSLNDFTGRIPVTPNEIPLFETDLEDKNYLLRVVHFGKDISTFDWTLEFQDGTLVGKPPKSTAFVPNNSMVKQTIKPIASGKYDLDIDWYLKGAVKTDYVARINILGGKGGVLLFDSNNKGITPIITGEYPNTLYKFTIPDDKNYTLRILKEESGWIEGSYYNVVAWKKMCTDQTDDVLKGRFQWIFCGADPLPRAGYAQFGKTWNNFDIPINGKPAMTHNFTFEVYKVGQIVKKTEDIKVEIEMMEGTSKGAGPYYRVAFNRPKSDSLPILKEFLETGKFEGENYVLNNAERGFGPSYNVYAWSAKESIWSVLDGWIDYSGNWIKTKEKGPVVLSIAIPRKQAERRDIIWEGFIETDTNIEKSFIFNPGNDFPPDDEYDPEYSIVKVADSDGNPVEIPQIHYDTPVDIPGSSIWLVDPEPTEYELRVTNPLGIYKFQFWDAHTLEPDRWNESETSIDSVNYILIGQTLKKRFSFKGSDFHYGIRFVWMDENRNHLDFEDANYKDSDSHILTFVDKI
ncbi:hypothetical protein ACFLZN_02160, partial [Nanoarchaeota archaeon]